MFRIMPVALIAATILLASSAPAGVIITVEETAGDVVMTGSGSADISLLTFDHDSSPNSLVNPLSVLILGQRLRAASEYTHPSITGPEVIGPGITSIFPDTMSGKRLGIIFSRSPPALFFPQGYVSGNPLSSSATYVGHTIASLGLAEGEYTWTWDTATGSDFRDTATGSDFLTIDIVPEPGTLGLVGMAGLACFRRRRD